MDAALAEAFEATWPAAEYADAGGFRVGRGLGAGGRVSSGRVIGPWTAEDIAGVEDISHGWGQPAMFRVLDDDARLAAALQQAGYRAETPTMIMSAALDGLTDLPIPPVTTFSVWPPLAIQREIWSAGNIDPARQAVLDRVAVPKTSILGRTDDRAAGAGFVAMANQVAMVHAVEVRAEWRRRGLAGWMMREAAFWARDNGATRMGLAVTRGNTGAIAAYHDLGFQEVAGYRYYTRG
ncbi:GNAT family N-acetyltransferase [Paracoccus sp. 11-3]|uniref:GNAT family N-acetyltransferase n=1 Tax=Paracoccus amoyensis TaxID=2760093 RepID=A0A926GDJ0_9RHOB|nr:GNAT family N-acetyltransferase [Paracoccus amoyensis]MBC9246511.1 GNAT family N-acetyltransferase [Paracoccus amoyensis]